MLVHIGNARRTAVPTFTLNEISALMQEVALGCACRLEQTDKQLVTAASEATSTRNPYMAESYVNDVPLSFLRMLVPAPSITSSPALRRQS